MIGRRQYPKLAETMHGLVRAGRLRAVLPGVYAATSKADDLDVRLQAVPVWDPNAVIVGAAAAKLTFWPESEVPQIELAVTSRRGSYGNFVVSRRKIPIDLVAEVRGLRCATPALTALDLITSHGGNAIDTVLRTRAATLSQLHEALALTPSRRGNVDRRVLLLDSRDEPWSEAERDAHGLLRSAGITGWQANFPFELLSGIYYLDVAFPAHRLAIEIDGREFHEGAEVFESDRWRQNDIVLAGWRVLRFTGVDGPRPAGDRPSPDRAGPRGDRLSRIDGG